MSIASPRGIAGLDKPFEFTATVVRDSCELVSTKSRQPMRLGSVPVGSLMEVKLTSRQELSIRERGSLIKPFSDSGRASWSWELRTKLAGSYQVALVVIVHDKDTREVVDESEPLYIPVDVAPSTRQFVAEQVKSGTSFLDSVPAVLAGSTALLAIVSALGLTVFGRKRSSDTEPEHIEPGPAGPGTSDSDQGSTEPDVAPPEPGDLPPATAAPMPFDTQVTDSVSEARVAGQLVWRSWTCPGEQAVDVTGRIAEFNWRTPTDTGNAFVKFVAYSGNQAVDEQVRRVGPGNSLASFQFDLGGGVGADVEITSVTVQVGLYPDQPIAGPTETFCPSSSRPE
ncbi:hypothetical protein [Nocardia sp. NPDC049149]|uniref:hypothetical protein n=1 Tax=Nocardia sp. NPDC049149 TaxID=3364315 RepID=UPI00371FECA2